MSQRTSALQVLTRYWVLAQILGVPFGLPAIVVGVISVPFFALVAGIQILDSTWETILHGGFHLLAGGRDA